MATRAPDDPTRPVSKSVAAAGECASDPENITNVTVGDDETTHGLLIKWDSGEWFYAESDSYESLDDAR